LQTLKGTSNNSDTKTHIEISTATKSKKNVKKD
jgi:hypothetical protein